MRKTDLIQHVLEGVRRIDGETHEQHVGLGVGEGAQTVVLLLPGGVPECELDKLVGYRVRLVGNVVLEYSRDVFLRGLGGVEGFGGEAHIGEVALRV